MKRQRLLLTISAVVSATLWAYACGDGTTEPTPPPPDPPRPTTVTVSPATAELTALGATVQFSAEVRDQNGQVMAGTTVTWATSAAAVATVGPSGMVTAVANGSATITATAGTASGSATVTVAQEVSAVTVAPDTATVLEGDTLRLAATATDANGQVVAGVEFTWASGDTAVAVVDASGLVTGVGAGQAEVMATAAGVTGLATLTVLARVPTTVAVTPDTVVLTAVGQTAQLTAQVHDQLGRVMDGIPVAWSSADTTVAVVDSAGLVSAVGGGAATVTAQAGEASGDVLVTVMQSVDSVTVEPPADTIAVGDTLRLVAEAYDDSGHVVAGAVFTWSSSNAAVATVDSSGLVRGVVVGTTTITATAGAASGTSKITVTNPDRAALMAFYNATDGPNWVINDNWLTDAPLSEWYGVDTNAAGRVVRIDLAGRWDNDARQYVSPGLRGELPGDLANLTELEILFLGNNDLTGAIPPELGGLTNLQHLGLSSNALAGAIPSELGTLTNLQYLGLGGNRLTGPIPPWLSDLTKLRFLRLGPNDLTGAIPPELGDLTNLSILQLSSNDLTGAIPPELGDLANLQELYLGSNALVGRIPAELGNLARLRNLHLGFSGLTGPIPPELGNLANLQRLSLGGSALSGPIPAELGNLAALVRLGLERNELSGPIPSALGNLAELSYLHLGSNDLTGPIPAELEDLANLEWLDLSENAISGPIPAGFINLPLQRLHWNATGACAPGTSLFVEWLDGIRDSRGPFCNASDRTALTNFFDLTDGEGWRESAGWPGGAALEEWHGVRTDSLGRVTALELSGNGLSGGLPGGVGDLARLTSFRIDGNPLAGRLPLSLAGLGLEELHYDGTDLCEPADGRFRAWLDGIPSRRGTGITCAQLTERDALVALYEATGGPTTWREAGRWLSSAPLGRWHGVEVDGRGRVVGLNLEGNALSGPIPPELAGLADLQELDLRFNSLSGSIPSELGNLAELTRLNLYYNDLTGPIPPELGGLANLEVLGLGGNDLTGRIPPELAGLANLQDLSITETALAGPIPPELGNLANLRFLMLHGNDLAGSIPPEIGRLTDLSRLALARNQGLAGAVPASLTNLRALEELQAGGTGLCVPSEPAFEAWLATIGDRWIAHCGGAMAYLTQAVQSRDHLVPLVAGKRALLRVFVTAAGEATGGMMPAVRARFFVNGAEQYVAEIPAGSEPIPTEVDEGDLRKSVNADIPARAVRPGLEMVVEIDPDGALDPGLGVPRRIPEEGRIAVEVREMPVLDLTVIPFLWSADPDSTVLEMADGMEGDPEGHFLLEDARVLLPVRDIDVTAHEPVASTSNSAFDLLRETGAIRVLEGGGGYWMGMMSGDVTGADGVAYTWKKESFSQPFFDVVAHELGHNMSLDHAPCGDPGALDPQFPQPNGRIGAWGYDFRAGGRLVAPSRPDLMSYCGSRWISDYHFSNALRYRLFDEGAAAVSAASASTRSLLLWGGVGANSVPFLEPAFLIDAPAALPDSAGEFRITGRTAGGGQLFSLSFTMPPTADGDGSSSFAFALPVRTGWEDSLATITLSGPGGSVTLDGESDIPMAILRNPRTGQVRGILRDPPSAAEVAADAVGGAAPGLEVLFSRGIPGAAAWRR